VVSRPSAIVRALVLAAVVLGLAAPLRGAPRARPDGAGQPTPLRSLTTVDGATVKLGEGAGATHLLFVARWCSPCETEVHALRRAAAQLRREGGQVVLVGVSRRQTAQEFAEWARGLGFDGALVFDDGGRVESAFGAELIPWHVVVGSGGRILHSGAGRPAPPA
jgi:peroxiredoxin